MALDDLLARPGLPPTERLLVRIKALLWPGRWDELRDCFARAREAGVTRRQVEEALLQGILFCGFPRSIHGFGVLAEAWPAASEPAGGGLATADQPAAGREFFAAIYGKNSDTVQAMLKGYHGELHDFVLDVAYGRVMARPGLEPRVRELLAVGVLALLGQTRLVISHGRGALHFGADDVQVYEAIYTATEDDTRARQLQRLTCGTTEDHT